MKNKLLSKHLYRESGKFQQVYIFTVGGLKLYREGLFSYYTIFKIKKITCYQR